MQVRDAMAKAGVGKIGNYQKCEFITRGEAQFEPTNDADPTIGEKQKIDIVPAVKIESWCFEDQVEDIVEAIKKAHPNEEPGIELVPIEII